MGFYKPAQLIIDAENHGVPFRCIDINHSFWDNILEEKSGNYFSVRLGFRQVHGIRAEDIQTLIKARTHPFISANQLLDAGISIAALEKISGCRCLPFYWS